MKYAVRLGRTNQVNCAFSRKSDAHGMHPNDVPKSYDLTEAGDRYFDGLADKFSRSLYQAPRGELRLAMLDYLLPQMLLLNEQNVLDVGGGLGRQASLQDLPPQSPGPWSLITCHAVLEWLGDPQAALANLSDLLAPGGQLSLMVFNRDALRFSNVVKGNLEKALSDRLEGKGKRQRLTPISPITHNDIAQWSAANGLKIDAVAGIRVFQDYLRHPPATPAEKETLLALEKQYCRQDPHWRLGRYLLYTLTKPESPE